MSTSLSPLAQHPQFLEMIISESKDVSLSMKAGKEPSRLSLRILPECTLSTIHISIEEKAIVDCVVFIDGASDTPLTLTLTSALGREAIMRWHCITLAKRSTTQTLMSRIQGERSESEVNWMFACDTEITHSISATNAFMGREGRGEITLKGVARGNGKATVYGMIDIGLGGTGTDTYLTEDVLMLSPTAKIDATPALEIKTNDVKASHSATISRVTKEDLFYFQSRGIDEKTAEAMYIDGFFGVLFERIPEEVRGHIQKK
jgi:Fe-S cluster assembly scaffold protein SufB